MGLAKWDYQRANLCNLSCAQADNAALLALTLLRMQQECAYTGHSTVRVAAPALTAAPTQVGATCTLAGDARRCMSWQGLSIRPWPHNTGIYAFTILAQAGTPPVFQGGVKQKECASMPDMAEQQNLYPVYILTQPLFRGEMQNNPTIGVN
jgi:hypothetical protein